MVPRAKAEPCCRCQALPPGTAAEEVVGLIGVQFVRSPASLPGRRRDWLDGITQIREDEAIVVVVPVRRFARQDRHQLIWLASPSCTLIEQCAMKPRPAASLLPTVHPALHSEEKGGECRPRPLIR